MIFDFFEDNMFVDNIYLDISAFICEDIEFDIFDYFFITTFCSYDDNQEIQSYIFFNFLYKLICFFLYIIIIVSLISFLNSRIYLNNFLLFFIKLLNESTNNIAKKNMIIRTITAFLTMVVSITYIYIYFNVTFKSHYFIYFCVLINLSVFAGMFFSFKTRFLIVLEGFHKNWNLTTCTVVDYINLSIVMYRFVLQTSRIFGPSILIYIINEVSINTFYCFSQINWFENNIYFLNFRVSFFFLLKNILEYFDCIITCTMQYVCYVILIFLLNTFLFTKLKKSNFFLKLK